VAFRRVGVFAVEDTSLQVCWADLPPGRWTFTAGDRSAEAEGGRPGAVTLDGLTPSVRYDVVARGPDGRRRRIGRVRTLAPPPGRELYRFATVNDVHIGTDKFGFLGTMKGPGSATVCAAAALAEAVEWGAQLLVVKGDLTDKGRPREWEQVSDLLGDLPVPVAVVLGNHDVKPGAVDGGPALAARGIELAKEPEAIDVPGIRIVLADTSIPEEGIGRVGAQQRERVAELASGATAAFVAVHHYPQRFAVPTMWPPGIPGPEAARFLDALAAANASTIVASGHSHRHRRHRHGPIVVTEIGSTKDYPGAWAGYAVHEDGIRQVVRRIAAPAAIAWTEYTRWALGGLWGAWSPGLLSHRCFSLTWRR
jgi:3',5'-cyclic-AMP phosphodiesterase